MGVNAAAARQSLAPPSVTWATRLKIGGYARKELFNGLSGGGVQKISCAAGGSKGRSVAAFLIGKPVADQRTAQASAVA